MLLKLESLEHLHGKQMIEVISSACPLHVASCFGNVSVDKLQPAVLYDPQAAWSRILRLSVQWA